MRVTNVDSQESAKSILVQVIGEMSNRAAPHRKFVQTFILAEQPTGYYVLNDVFRYIVDEEEEDEPVNDVEGGQAQTAESEIAPPNLAISGDPAEQEDVVEKVDQKLKQEVLDKPGEPLPTALAAPNGINASDASAEKAPEDSSISTKSDAPVEEQAAESADIEEIVQPEKPRDPDPTPIASPPKPTKSTPTETPAQPPKPTAPKTWANLVASKGATATPINPGPKASTTATTTTSNSKASVAPIKGNTTPPTPATEDSTVKPQQNGANGWQTAGTDKQRQGRQHSQSVSSTMGPDSVLAYVKNVTDKVDASILKAKLTDYGKLLYFDVSRQKVRATRNHSFSHLTEFRIVHSSNLRHLLPTMPAWLPILTTLVANKSSSRSVGLVKMLMAAISTAEEVFAVVDPDLMSAPEVKDGVDSIRIVAVVHTAPVVVVAP